VSAESTSEPDALTPGTGGPDGTGTGGPGSGDGPGNGGPGNGKLLSKDWQWNRLQFKLGNNWYSATQFNAPNQPVEELSWRNYGRFGFFFKKKMKQGDVQKLNYRFHIAPSEQPALESFPPQVSKEQEKHWRAAAQKAYAQFSNWVVKQ